MLIVSKSVRLETETYSIREITLFKSCSVFQQWCCLHHSKHTAPRSSAPAEFISTCISSYDCCNCFDLSVGLITQLHSAVAVTEDVRFIRLTGLIHSVVSSHCALTQIKSHTKQNLLKTFCVKTQRCTWSLLVKGAALEFNIIKVYGLNIVYEPLKLCQQLSAELNQ